MEKNIEIKNLCKVYGNITILDDINFVAKEGRVTAFLGPNGAGKSSTLRILLGLDQATSGSATIAGINYKDIRNPLFVVGATFDGLGSPSDRTVYQHLRIVAASNGIKKSRIDEVLAVTDIAHKKNESIGHLSLGETQRVSLATALLGNPQFLILDEPTNGLDPSGIRWLRNFLKEQSEKEIASLTQDLEKTKQENEEKVQAALSNKKEALLQMIVDRVVEKYGN